MINLIPQPGNNQPRASMSHKQLVKMVQHAYAGNAALAKLLQQQDLAAKFAWAEITTHRDILSHGAIIIPWHRATIALMEKLIRILAGNEPIPTLNIPCHACGANMVIPNIGPQPKGSIPLCTDCAQLVDQAAAAIGKLPQPQQDAILQKYGCPTLPAIASLFKPTLTHIINKEAK